MVVQAFMRRRHGTRLLAPVLMLALLATLFGVTATTSSPVEAATGGNILLTGHDADFHCTGGQQCHYVQIAVDFVRNGSALPLLVLDHGSEVQTALTSAFPGGAPPAQVVDPRSGFAGVPLLDGAGKPRYSAIVVASDWTCGGCDNNQPDATSTSQTPDSDAINARSTDIAAFFNAGGGILALAGADNRDVYYKFVPVPATGAPVTAPFTFTQVGLALGFVEGQDNNCCATHNSFTLPPAGSALQVAETDTAGLAETLIATGASICPTGFCGGGGNFALTLSTTPGGTARVTAPTPSSGPGSFSFPSGTQVSLTASPNPGYLFAGWTVGGVPVGNGDPLGLTMNANYNVKASFVLNPNFAAWASLGGILTDAPTAASFHGRVYVFARGSDNALYVTSSADGATFTPWRSLGGILTAAPAATSTGNALYVFAKGSDNQLYVASSTDGATFTGWRPLGGVLTTSPAAAAVGTTLYVFARGSDNALYVTRSTDGATFSGWQGLGGVLTDAPAAVGFQGVVYVYAKGSDNALYQKSSADGVNFGNWQDLGGILTAAPAAAAYNPTGSIPTLAVFARGTDAALYLRLSADGVSFTDWMSLGGRVVGKPAAAGLGDNQLFAFVRSVDNALWVRHTQP